MSISLENAIILGTSVAGTSANAPSSSELASQFSNEVSIDPTQTQEAEEATQRFLDQKIIALAGKGGNAVSGGLSESIAKAQSVPNVKGTSNGIF